MRQKTEPQYVFRQSGVQLIALLRYSLDGFMQNLSSGEIVDQVLQLSNRSSSKITNVVFMGMGEPFLNYQRVIEVAKIMNENENGSRRITISTAGIVSNLPDGR